MQEYNINGVEVEVVREEVTRSNETIFSRIVDLINSSKERKELDLTKKKEKK